jgi:hypothetical protein
VEAILGYRTIVKQVTTRTTKNNHKYLIRWRRGTTADDSWVRGWMLSSKLHPYMELLHNKFGGENICLSSENII